MAPTLKVVEGPASGGAIPLQADELLIGREGTGAGSLGGDQEISRRHARVYRHGDRILIEDLGSTNGTLVNGSRIGEPTELHDGDTVEVGGTRLRLELPPPPPPAPSRPTAYLRVVAGPASGSSVPITDEEFVIGRGETEPAGRLGGDAELSRRHALVSLADGGLLVEDLGSTNGTFVNGRRIPAPTLVRPGDAIWIGNSTLVVTTPQQPIPEVAPVAPPTPSGESGLLGRFATLSDRHPKRILAAIGVFFLIAAPLGGPVAKLLHAEDPFVDSSAESVTTENRIAALKNEVPGPQVIALLRGQDVDSAATRRRVKRITDAMKAERLVTRTSSFYSTRSRQFVSRDKRSTYVMAFFKDSTQTQREDAAQRLIDKLEGTPGLSMGGSAVSGLQLGEQVTADLGKAEGMVFPILFVLSLFVFRGVVAALLPLFVGLLTVMTTFFALRIINSFVSLSEFALNVVIALGLGLAIDYSLFIVSRYREELARVGEGRSQSRVYGAIPRSEAGERFAGTESEALHRTIYTAGRTILYSAITVAMALAALIVFPQPFLYSMGIGGAVCALVAVTVALVALPSLLALLGPRINSLAPARWQRAALRTARQERSGPWYRLSQAVMRRPALIAAVSASVLLLMGLPALGIKFTGVDITAVPTHLSSRQVDDTLGRDFATNPTTGTVSMLVRAKDSDRKRVERFATDVRGRSGSNERVRLPVTNLKGDNWEVQVVPEGAPLAKRSLALVEGIRAGPNPFPVGVTGQTATFIDQKATIKTRLPLAIAILCVTTLVVLFLMTGSVVLPIKSLLMNCLSLSAAFGLLVLIFQEGHLEGLLGFESAGALDLSQPVLLFAVAFGLATDYAVFLLTRIKEARTPGTSEQDAVAIGLERTGRIVTQAALLFCIAIGAFATSSVIFIKEVGVGIALAVIIDATIIRALLVPSLMALLGARNWWAPGPLRRLHEKIGLSEG